MERKTEREHEYDLFISHYRRDMRIEIGRRKVDIVAIFKTELERHLRPKSLVGPRRFKVCTDVDGFELGDTFDAVMSARISRSRKFLLVCSPHCAESPFVKQEVNLFLALKPGEKPLVAVFRRSAGAAFPGLVSDTVVAADLDQPAATTLAEWQKGLRRESHKVVAWVWGIQPSAVFDRFQAQQRGYRNRLLAAAAAIAAGVVALVLYLGGDLGLHRASELAPPRKLVAPAGTGFAVDGKTPIVFRDGAAYLWDTSRPDNAPAEIALPVDALYAVQQAPGRELLADVGAVSVVDLKDRRELAHRDLDGEVAGIAAFEEAAAISVKDGSLFFLLADGRRVEAPRPISEAGRRFSAFRETGPFGYGELLAMNDKYLATATLTGRLGLLDRLSLRFVIPDEPQFPLAEPVERRADPVLYETENTRAISALAFLENGDLMFAEGAGLRTVDPRTGKITFLSHCPIDLVRQILPLPRSRKIVALTSSTLEVLEFYDGDPTRLRCIAKTNLTPKTGPSATLAPNGRELLVAYFDSAPDLWRPSFQLFGWQIPAPAWFW
jgi:TIR domain-containing protein